MVGGAVKSSGVQTLNHMHMPASMREGSVFRVGLKGQRQEGEKKREERKTHAGGGHMHGLISPSQKPSQSEYDPHLPKESHTVPRVTQSVRDRVKV